MSVLRRARSGGGTVPGAEAAGGLAVRGLPLAAMREARRLLRSVGDIGGGAAHGMFRMQKSSTWRRQRCDCGKITVAAASMYRSSRGFFLL